MKLIQKLIKMKFQINEFNEQNNNNKDKNGQIKNMKGFWGFGV